MQEFFAYSPAKDARRVSPHIRKRRSRGVPVDDDASVDNAFEPLKADRKASREPL